MILQSQWREFYSILLLDYGLLNETADPWGKGGFRRKGRIKYIPFDVYDKNGSFWYFLEVTRFTKKRRNTLRQTFRYLSLVNDILNNHECV